MTYKGDLKRKVPYAVTVTASTANKGSSWAQVVWNGLDGTKVPRPSGKLIAPGATVSFQGTTPDGPAGLTIEIDVPRTADGAEIRVDEDGGQKHSAKLKGDKWWTYSVS